MPYVCPKCGQDDLGFTEVLTHCVVTRTVDNDLDHVETEDWDITDNTASEYVCPCCRFRTGRAGLKVK
ncbi:MAG: hypothetical protein AB1816_07875 [Bacillota bacterium]